MSRKLRVLFVSPEASPFAKSGDLADVARALPASLAKLGVEISLALPKHRRPKIEALTMEIVVPELVVPLGDERIKASVYKAETWGYPVYFIESPKYFYRDEIYGSSKEEYLDNDARFTYFSRAVLEFLLKAKIVVDIIHCNDWPTALIPLFLKTHYAQKSQFRDTATVLSLHSASHQGEFPPESLALTGLNWDFFTPDQLALNGKFNFLKAGLLFSDAFNGVKAPWSHDLTEGDSGQGFEVILGRRRDVTFTISNGMDDRTWELAARKYIELYAKALQIRRGGQSD